MYLSSVTVRGFRAAASEELACSFPARFSVLLGANNAGKTTVCDALYLAHPHRFPQLPRPSIAALGDAPRVIDVAFKFSDDGREGPLGESLKAQAQQPPRWSRRLERSLGDVRAAGVEDGHHVDETRLLYLPAHRNPVDELARREAKVLVELLRAEQERRQGHRNLADLRNLAADLLDGLLSHDLIQSLEARISGYLGVLTGGVARQHAFVGRQEVDDAFLARVLELLLAAIDDRALARRLEVSGLGYVNLLHIAVTLAAVPGGESTPDPGPPAPAALSGPEVEPPPPGDEFSIEEAQDKSDALEDSFFPQLFHASIVIEEPEAHLHPQLQHGLMRYLRRVTSERPEIQVIVSTHSSEMITACQPSDIVVLRQEPNGKRVSRCVVSLPLDAPDLESTLRLTTLHFDASRSASLFADRLAVVEGVTDALLLRQLGLAWARDDSAKRAFVDAMTIVPIGSRVGQWVVRLLATPSFELATKVAILRDTDERSGQGPKDPEWLSAYSPNTVRCFLNHPTLEPAITPGNEDLVADALRTIGLKEVPDPVTAATIDGLFLNAGRTRKGEFAYALAAAMSGGVGPQVPLHIIALFDYLYPVQLEATPPDAADRPDV